MDNLRKNTIRGRKKDKQTEVVQSSESRSIVRSGKNLKSGKILRKSSKDAKGNQLVTVMIISPSILFMNGIRKIIEAAEDMKVIVETSNEAEILPLIKKNKPDILVYDTDITDCNFLQILESIIKVHFELKVLLLLHNLEEEFIINSLLLGVSGYLKPTAHQSELIKALRAIIKDELWIERSVVSKVLKRVLNTERPQIILQPNLTKREDEIKELVHKGFSNKEIAEKLYISENTVKTHLVHIFSKLSVTNRIQLTNNLSEDNNPE